MTTRNSGSNMRSSVLIMKSITLFLAGRKNRAITTTNPQLTKNQTKHCKKKMSENDNSYKCSIKTLEAAKKDTLLTRTEIEALYKIFKKLILINKTKTNQSQIKPSQHQHITGKAKPTQEGIDRIIFREILHNTFDIVTENTLMDRIFNVWDKSNVGSITLESWLHGLSLFLKGSFAKQIEYCFTVYDLNSDGFITKDEMFQLLKNCLIKHPQDEDPDESVRDLVDIITKKMDKDKDGKVSLNDFTVTIKDEPLLLEAFGRCLPSERSKIAFLSTLKA